MDEWPAWKRLATGLQRRQMGLPPQVFQAELLKEFDAADLAGKERMLGPLWLKWPSAVLEGRVNPSSLAR
ncbi:MAG: hypothetical protein ACREQC_12100 [Candidatus Binataceae bacterium]